MLAYLVSEQSAEASPEPQNAAVRGAMLLPARREDIALRTSDGLTLLGELALPLTDTPRGMIVALHPNPTAGGSMDSHLIRKAAARLPALAGIGVLRFNTRGTASPRGRSEGRFGASESEGPDVEAALRFVAERGLPLPWLVGWSFGSELIVRHARHLASAGVVLLSPPLRRSSPEELAARAGDGRPFVALVPEHDEFLAPDEARRRFASVPHARVIAAAGAKHLWVGETQTRFVLDYLADVIAPEPRLNGRSGAESEPAGR